MLKVIPRGRLRQSLSLIVRIVIKRMRIREMVKEVTLERLVKATTLG
jgi:hypothetical protein